MKADDLLTVRITKPDALSFTFLLTTAGKEPAALPQILLYVPVSAPDAGYRWQLSDAAGNELDCRYLAERNLLRTEITANGTYSFKQVPILSSSGTDDVTSGALLAADTSAPQNLTRLFAVTGAVLLFCTAAVLWRMLHTGKRGGRHD